ncbi:hypothetical protein DFA_06527 [Cavenderia fasciculata]|uniref:Transmembrane protein n=1 Tax=Cavenderia fasciculata TaxID=261658 RepID=F4PJ91_CACFS|nr:uncharacterized protein DFA_06527 [Cavenderia fasciculata]EGG24377.1 hypothetical protein DFA_06527 [Cavenderia fasciculata]|eukprot:XP_004362228.1 hypothetical protein DFA_06527 [Cavenderia fasciculata]
MLSTNHEPWLNKSIIYHFRPINNLQTNMFKLSILLLFISLLLIFVNANYDGEIDSSSYYVTIKNYGNVNCTDSYTTSKTESGVCFQRQYVYTCNIANGTIDEIMYFNFPIQKCGGTWNSYTYQLGQCAGGSIYECDK